MIYDCQPETRNPKLETIKKTVNKTDLEIKGVRAIAIFEACKGVLGIIVGIGLISLMHKDLTAFAENLIDTLHFDPAGNFAQKFIENVGKINESNIILVIGICALYVLVRFVEAYGLWFLRPWAEWFAIAAGAVYVPFEVFELIKKPTFVRAGILLFNLALIAYLYYFRKEQKHEKEIHDSQIQAKINES